MAVFFLLTVGLLAAGLAGCGAPVSVREKKPGLRNPGRASLDSREGVLDFVLRWHAAGCPSRWDGRDVLVEGPGRDLWDPRYFDKLIPAEGVSFRGLTHRHTREGVGIPLIGWRENRGREPVEVHYPPEGITRPVTVLVEEQKNGSVSIALWNPALRSRVGGEMLAGDLTAPWAYLLARTRTLHHAGLGGLLNAAQTPRRPKVYLMEPYDPQKKVLLMVHGLLSTPLAWMELTNDLRADPEIRHQYQIWHFHYPSGMPFLYSAKVLREEYERVRLFLDPGQRDPAMKNTVVIAHSMGGLISKTLVTHSGEEVWPTTLTRPPEKMSGSKADLETLRSIFRWEARPEVRRVIFVAVPHGGSRMATDWIGRFGDLLTAIPEEFSGLYRRVDRQNPGALHGPLANSLRRGRLTAIDTLSPRHPVLAALNGLPLAPGVETHSIIGRTNPAVELERSSDGVVPYTSSHFPAAVSEVVVHSGHDAFRPPEALQEFRRILLLPVPEKE